MILQDTVKEKKKKKIERGKCETTILKSEHEWTLPAQLEQPKTRQDGKRLLQRHLWCPNNFARPLNIIE